MRDKTLTLPDGRDIAYTIIGATDGSTAMYFHGAPGSRLDLVNFEEDLTSLGVRIVSPDRPGYGASSPQLGRHLSDWPADIAALADHLGLGRFAAIGYSSGGAYAAVAASSLPDRVFGAAIVAGTTDMRWPDAWDGSLSSEPAMRLGDEDAATDFYVDLYGADGARFFDGTGDLAPADTALFEDQDATAAFLATIAEAFRQGVDGFAQDAVVQSRGWPFDPVAVSVPVEVLHGEADTFVPIAHGRHTAEVLPTATLTTFADHGHLSIIYEIPELAARLTASPGTGLGRPVLCRDRTG